VELLRSGYSLFKKKLADIMVARAVENMNGYKFLKIREIVDRFYYTDNRYIVTDFSCM
jgi:hypothetical protein